jgi:hypothetical protein
MDNEVLLFDTIFGIFVLVIAIGLALFFVDKINKHE